VRSAQINASGTVAPIDAARNGEGTVAGLEVALPEFLLEGDALMESFALEEMA